MNQSNSSTSVTRRQLIKKVTHLTLGAAGVFGSLGVDYQKPTLMKLTSLTAAAETANSKGGGPPV